MWPVTRVCALVQAQRCLGAQALATLSTAVTRPAALVHMQHMPPHILLALELLPAELTGEVALAAVYQELVTPQVAAVGKGLSTCVTAVYHLGGHTMVLLDMLQEALLVQKGFVT